MGPVQFRPLVLDAHPPTDSQLDRYDDAAVS